MESEVVRVVTGEQDETETQQGEKGIPWGRGEKDWRMSWRGGREASWRSCTRSGEETRQTCGLSDDGSTGGISSIKPESVYFTVSIDIYVRYVNY